MRFTMMDSSACTPLAELFFIYYHQNLKLHSNEETFPKGSGSTENEEGD